MLEKFKNTWDKGVAAVSVKSETMVETSRTKTAINNAQKKMEGELIALGQKLYLGWQAGQITGMFDAECASIRAIEQEIAGYNARLEEIKAEESRVLGGGGARPAGGVGTIFCGNCGKSITADSRFCDGCGSPVSQ